MGTPRFIPEFKEEAIKQITQRGCPVTEVTERLGVSAYNLYQWAKAVIPDTRVQQSRSSYRQSMKRIGTRHLVDGSLAVQDIRVLVHSDQRSQFGSDDCKRFCTAHKLGPNMSQRGNCWDHTVVEFLFSRLKKDRIRKRIYKKQEMARTGIFDDIEVFYNRSRRHIILTALSPRRLNAPRHEVRFCLSHQQSLIRLENFVHSLLPI